MTSLQYQITYLVLSVHTAVSRICFQKSPYCPCSMHNYVVYSFLPVCSIPYNSFSIPFKIDIQDETQKNLENNVVKWAFNWKFSRNSSASPNTVFTQLPDGYTHQHTYRLIKHFSTPLLHYAPLNCGCLCDHIFGSSVSYVPSAQPMCYIITNMLHLALFYKTTTPLNCN